MCGTTDEMLPGHLEEFYGVKNKKLFCCSCVIQRKKLVKIKMFIITCKSHFNDLKARILM